MLSFNRRVKLVAGITLALLAITVAAWAHQVFFDDAGFGAPIDPAIPLASLKTVENPVFPEGGLRDDLAIYIRDTAAAIQLGKAFYWDMQAGSDDRVACATCHHQAGVDPRVTNQLHPGANNTFDITVPNSELLPGDFPFTDHSLNREKDDFVGSQGVRKSRFLSIDSRTGAEKTVAVSDPVFTYNRKNTRRVTKIQAGSTINAVFNHRNFWNGRAQPEFNGVNVFGDRDISARVWQASTTGVPVQIDIHINNASLASQAVGPLLNSDEMSAGGRAFRDVGRKLLLRKPLGLQQVSPTDSVLGSLADKRGLKVSYASLIQQAFQPKWWNASRTISINGQSYTMMEANFALYWGLSIMLYEATLVSDDTPIDRYLDSGRLDPSALDGVVQRLNDEGFNITRDNILNGLALFETPQAAGGAGCIECHGGPELTLASMGAVLGNAQEELEHMMQMLDFRVERMFMNNPAVPAGATGILFEGGGHEEMASYGVEAIMPDGERVPVPVAVYDAGFYDIGVRPMQEDIGLGGTDPFGNPLSFTRLFQMMLFPEIIHVPGEKLAGNSTGQVVVDLSGPLLADEPVAIDGSFKTPSLRNVELSGPYLRNGGKATLQQIMKFYNDGGDFPENPHKAPLIIPLGLTDAEMTDLVAFLLALTDERVRWNRAPFDHPQLGIPVGQKADGSDIIHMLPAVGAAGSATPLKRFLNLSPFQP